jgi:hypothetical protein
MPLDMLNSRTISFSDGIRTAGPYSPLVIRSSRIACQLPPCRRGHRCARLGPADGPGGPGAGGATR